MVLEQSICHQLRKQTRERESILRLTGPRQESLLSLPFLVTLSPGAEMVGFGSRGLEVGDAEWLPWSRVEQEEIYNLLLLAFI